MQVLVSTASKHGSTADIGRAIADVLIGEGIEARILAPEEVTSLDSYDAIILGSAVYAGHRMKPMRELVDRLEAELAGRPVWLFSSGPIGDPPKPEEDPVDVAPIMEKTDARAALNFHLTKSEKKDIAGALKSTRNQQTFAQFNRLIKNSHSLTIR